MVLPRMRGHSVASEQDANRAAWQQLVNEGGACGTACYEDGYDPNVDYVAIANNAKATAAKDAEIAQLRRELAEAKQTAEDLGKQWFAAQQRAEAAEQRVRKLEAALFNMRTIERDPLGSRYVEVNVEDIDRLLVKGEK